MNFGDLFLKEDVVKAELTFHNLIASMKLIHSYQKKGDKENEVRLAAVLTNSLIELNEMAIRKDESKQMYLHHLLNYPQRWYPV